MTGKPEPPPKRRKSDYRGRKACEDLLKEISPPVILPSITVRPSCSKITTVITKPDFMIDSSDNSGEPGDSDRSLFAQNIIFKEESRSYCNNRRLRSNDEDADDIPESDDDAEESESDENEGMKSDEGSANCDDKKFRNMFLNVKIFGEEKTTSYILFRNK